MRREGEEEEEGGGRRRGGSFFSNLKEQRLAARRCEWEGGGGRRKRRRRCSDPEQSRPQHYHIKLNAFAAEMSSFDQTPPHSHTPNPPAAAAAGV